MSSISSSRRLVIGGFVLRLSSRHFSTSTATSSNSTSGFHHQSRRHDEESRNVKVFVWWDFENCSPPVGSNVYRVSQSITAAIRSNGIKGPVQITAFGDVLQLSRSNQVALSATGIILTHVPQGGKNSADRSLLMNLMYWVSQNPPPAHLFLISGDRDFASILHRLRMNNYNILLASRDDASGVLCSAASIMWDWNALVKGENLYGKHFNQPPDGPYGSWYGHYRVPIEDPFSSSEQPNCLKSEELSKSNSEIKPRPVPKPILNAIRSILKSNPKGIAITDLRAELAKSNLTIDKEFYGYKKFSRFLLSMPQILKVESEGSGYYSVHGVVPKVSEIGESSIPVCPSHVTTSTEIDSTVSSKKNGRDMCREGAGIENSSSPSSPKSNTKKSLSEVQEPLKEVTESQSQSQSHGQCSSPLVEKESIVGSIPGPLHSNTKKSLSEVQEPLKEVTDSQSQSHGQCSSPLVEKESIVGSIPGPLHSSGESRVATDATEEGFLKRLWSKWLRGEDSEVESGKSFRTKDNTEKIKHEVQCVESSGTSPDPVGLSSSSSSNEKADMTLSSASINKINVDEDIKSSSVVNDDKPSKHTGIFSRIMSWCKFWKSDQDAKRLNEEVDGRKGKRGMDLEMQELFSESLWNDMLVFLKTPKGSVSILQSKTRKEMVQNIQKQGPSSVLSLTEAHLFHLVDLLISDKHWVEESITQAFPFRLVLPSEKSSQKNPSNKESTSILSDQESKPGKDKGEKKCQSHPHITNKSSEKCRAQVLRDCQKLLNEVLKEYPDGYHMANFRNLFLSKYGYSLDVQKLGYQKLTSLLQIMPGVKIESSPTRPSAKVMLKMEPSSKAADSNNRKMDLKSDTESSKKDDDDDDSDSPWEELGPVAASSAGGGPQMVHMYETVSHDNESSDSEEEMLSERETKPKKNEEDSSLLEILDSWYSSKEDNNRSVAASDGTIGCDSKPSSSSGGVRINNEEDEVEVNFARKQRVHKTYSFVAEEPSNDNKVKLLNGIIGDLKKSRDGLSESSRI